MRRRTGLPRGRRRQTGAALILAMLIAGLLLASNVVSLEAFLLTMRAEQRGIGRMVDFHLADTMLTLCERRVAQTFGSNPRAGMFVDGSPASSVDAAAGIADAVGAAGAARTTNTADSAGRRTNRQDTAAPAVNPVTVLRDVMARKAEPTRWQDSRAFDTHESHASRIVFPAALAAPRRNVPLVCLVETWVDVPGAGRVLLLTTRVPAAEPGAGSGTWLQSVVVLTALGMQRHWRAVAEPPSPSF